TRHETSSANGQRTRTAHPGMLIIARTHRDRATAGPMLLVPDTPATPPLQCPRTPLPRCWRRTDGSAAGGPADEPQHSLAHLRVAELRIDEGYPVIQGLDGDDGFVPDRRGGANIPDIRGETKIKGAVAEHGRDVYPLGGSQGVHPGELGRPGQVEHA